MSIPKLITFQDVAADLRVPSEKLEHIAALNFAPYVQFGWRIKRVHPRDLPKWREAIARYDKIVADGPPRLKWGATSTAGYVYFIQCANGKGPIKVGTAKNVERRLASIQSHSPYELKLLAVEPGGEVQELQRHREFSLWRLHGEWFREDCLELKRAIRLVRKEWGYPRKNRVPQKISNFVERRLTDEDPED